MSELINTHDNRATIRWKLLTSASAAALIFSACGTSDAYATDSDRPVLWLELGGQLEQLSDKQEIFNPPFETKVTEPNLLSAFNVQNPPKFALGEEAKLSFQPEDSDWDFSASIRYGRSGAARHVHHQTPNKRIYAQISVPPAFKSFFKHVFPNLYYGISYYPNGHKRFGDGQTDQSEDHVVLDFQAGKDVGIGLFGAQGSSVISAGVRIAQFHAKDNVRLEANPDLQYPTAPITGYLFTAFPKLIAFRNTVVDFHDYTGNLIAKRSFSGLGPSVSWDASAAIAGNPQDGELTLDWGVNAALLFGRQKAKNHVQTTTFHYHSSIGWNPTNSAGGVARGHFFATGASFVSQPHTTQSTNHDRSRAVTVPNLGGTIGLSYRIQDFKVNMGYRVDWFFNAIDAGIATRKSEDRGFYGPYASISIGLGD